MYVSILRKSSSFSGTRVSIFVRVYFVTPRFLELKFWTYFHRKQITKSMVAQLFSTESLREVYMFIR